MTEHGQPVDVTWSEPGSMEAIPVIFLPGIIMPAALRYSRLLNELGDVVRPITKDLEVYATDTPPWDYSIATEVEGLTRAADAAGFGQFHLYGHSAGGAIALAYVAANPDRILSLALDEPASDFSNEARVTFNEELQRIDQMPSTERVRAFLQMQLAPGVQLPPPPEGPTPDWMAKRPAGIDAFTDALLRHQAPAENLRAFHGPVYYSYGSLSHPSWQAMRDRLAGHFADFTPELYEGVHHLNTSHQQEPTRVAAALRELWNRAAAVGS